LKTKTNIYLKILSKGKYGYFLKYTFFLILISFYGFSQNNGDMPDESEIGAKDMKVEIALTDVMKYYMAESYPKAIELLKEITKRYGEFSSVFYMQGKSELALNQSDKAMLSFKKAVDLDKNNYFYQQSYAEALFKNFAYKDAASILRKLIKQQPLQIENYNLLAEILMIEGKDSELLKLFAEMENTFGVSEEITQKKQLLLLKNNKVEAAIKEGKKLVKNDPEYVLQQAKILTSSNRYSDAIDLLQNSLTDNPSFFEAYSLLSEVYLSQKNNSKNEELLIKTLAQNSIPISIKSRIFTNQLILLEKEPSGVQLSSLLSQANTLIEQYPKESKPFLIKADLLTKKGDLLGARNAYLSAVKYESTFFEAWMAIVELDMKLGKFEDLVKNTEKALEFYPTQAYFWYHNAYGYSKTNQPEEALVALEEAKLLSSENKTLKTHILAMMGDVYQKLKKFEKSESAYEEALKVDANSEHVLNNYTYFLASRKKDLDKCLIMSKKLLELYPANPAYYNTRAFVFFQNGDFENAKATINQALSIGKEPSASILEHKGDILFKLGDKNQAVLFWKQALEKNPQNKNLERKIKEGFIE
jgi:tetratricopeptide (TPR) repeat protein